jgi:hypothetical protein
MLREMLNPAKQPAGLIAVVLFPAAFIAIGAFLFYRMALIIFQGRPAIYAITDRRALILEPGVPGRVHAFTPAQLRWLEKHARTDGSGDILFTQAPPISSAMSQPIQPGFLDIPGVEQAWGLLEHLAKTTPELAEGAALPAAAPDLQAVLNIVGKAYPKQARFLACGGNQPGTNTTPLALAPFQGVSDKQLARVRAAIALGEGLRWAGQPDPWQFALERLAARGVGVVSGRGAATAPLRHDIPEVKFYGLPEVDGVRRLMASIAVADRPSGI